MLLLLLVVQALGSEPLGSGGGGPLLPVRLPARWACDSLLALAALQPRECSYEVAELRECVLQLLEHGAGATAAG